MRFEIHAAGTPGPNTLLETCETFEAAAEAFALSGDAPADARAPWAIIPSGTAEELATLGGLYSIAPRYGRGGCYVLRAGDGFTTLGFENAEATRCDVLAWLEAEAGPHALAEYLARAGLPYEAGFPHCPAVGTPAAFIRYRVTMAAGADLNARTGKRCPGDLTPQLVGLEGKRVEVTGADGERRRFIVGRSSGWRPCHLEIARRNSSGGGAVWGAPFAAVRVIAGGR
jgi:hypothetical protein